jgi:hypothetical protein
MHRTLPACPGVDLPRPNVAFWQGWPGIFGNSPPWYLHSAIILIDHAVCKFVIDVKVSQFSKYMSW